MGNNTGTVNRVVINGVNYDVPADINITFNRSGFTIEGIPTSGKTIMKYTRRVQTQESVVLMTSPEEMETLNSVSESLSDVTVAVELADGSTYRTTCRINFENYESEEGRSTLTVIPSKSKNAWTPVLA
ncbi:hypothetical protein AMJ80_04470 [bacterium SM23_31]|nr:MAG: hypothetical protein AMJ80_04470 [bacterium SM23_31]